MVLSKFDSLSVRPPTPPKDLHDHLPDADADVDATLQFLEDPFGEKPVLPRIAAAKSVLNTPEPSPSSDIDIPSSSASGRKKVNFELKTCTSPAKKAVAQSWTPTRSSPLRPLPQTRISRPLKSILKPSDGTPTPPPNDDAAAAHKFKTFAEMLESIVKLLASADRASRLDAYHALQRTMQAYEKIPDVEALRQKMSLLTQFIRRDVQAPSPTGTGLDSQLIAQALKLLMALFRIANLTAAMDEDFCSFIVDRVITVASDSSMPKTIVNTHLAVLMQQNFRPKTMTTPRVEKILDVLDTITERVSGYSVQAYRIRVYRKLVQQRQDMMIKHTERWFIPTVRALTFSQKDINQSALDTALSVVKYIGHDPHVGRTILDLLNRSQNNGPSFGKRLAKEMTSMLEGDNAVLVPQMWAAMTALLRDYMQPTDFVDMRDWLAVLEKCLQHSKESVKVHSNVALCFLCYAINLGENTTDAWAKFLAKIPLSQLQNRGPRGVMKKAEGDAITAGYITLLYYAFRPNAPFKQYDRYWRDFVVTFWTPLVASSTFSSQQALAACRIVTALLRGSRKPWNEHRVLDLRPQYAIQRGELPLLDPQWVRKSLSQILQFVETLLNVTPWTESEQGEESPIKAMWLAILDALLEASSKEVMASSETKDAMAHIVNLFRRIWDSHTAALANSQQTEDVWAKKFCFLIETTIQKLSPSRFAEKCLTRNAKQDFEVASTPSHRSKQHGTRTSPLLYLIDLLINQSEGKLADFVRLRAVRLVLEPCFNAHTTRLAKLELLRDCAVGLPTVPGSAVVNDFWAQIATLLQSALQTHSSGSNNEAARPYGKEYDVVAELFAAGSTFMFNRSQSQDIMSTFVGIVRQEAGDGAVVLAVIEKISECVVLRVPDDQKSSCLSCVSTLLRNLPKQISRRILEQGRQNLYPSSPAKGRNVDFDPYNHLYGAIVSVGSAAYRTPDTESIASTKAYFNALSSAIQQSPTSHLAVFLRKTQDVVGMWVEDKERKLHSKEKPLKDLHKEITQMWTEVNKALERLPRKDAQILSHLETLITAGFMSRRRGIVNLSITTWNNTFGKEESLRYPPRLEKALRRLRKFVELSLPSMQIDGVESENDFSFYDSDTSMENVKAAFKSPRVKESPFKISRSKRRSMSRSPAVPTSASRRVPGKQTPKIRLRHDDSQIQFEPIVSSPSNPFNQESQVLTERQREMAERQMLATGLFADMGATSPQPEPIVTPMEFHSDAPSADDYTTHAPRTTPLKALAAMGPMDAFLGSSPTPHARKTTRHILNDGDSLATPTARRTRKMAREEDIGSSPPKLDMDPGSSINRDDNDIQVGSSIDFGQSQASFDDGTTIDEEAFLAAERDSKPIGEDESSDVIMSELPSSNIDHELTAQIDADMQAHAAEEETLENQAESCSANDFVDAASHQVSIHQESDHAGDTEVDESQSPSSPQNIEVRGSDAATSSTSRVGDSFSRSTPARRTAKNEPQSLRRSARRSVGSSPARFASVKQRKQTPGRKRRKSAAPEEVDSVPLPVQGEASTEDDDMFDTIIVTSSSPVAQQRLSSRKRKATQDAAPIIIPETNRRRGMRRSQSLLSQVQNSQDILIEDTPVPKRARQNLSQDVSEAKGTSTPTQESQSKRLSHIQVTPRTSTRPKSVVAEEATVSNAEKNEASKKNAGAEASGSTEDSQGAKDDASQQAAVAATRTPSRSFTERVILTPRSIINQLKNLKDYLFSAPQLVLGREEEREIDDALFDIRRQVHAAGLRGDDKQEGK